MTNDKVLLFNQVCKICKNEISYFIHIKHFLHFQSPDICYPKTCKQTPTVQISDRMLEKPPDCQTISFNHSHLLPIPSALTKYARAVNILFIRRNRRTNKQNLRQNSHVTRKIEIFQ